MKRDKSSAQYFPIVLLVIAGLLTEKASAVAVFNIMSFGAKGNGVSDDSEALVSAWNAACMVSGAIVKIPSKLTFLIRPVQLLGPCRPFLTLQIDGNILAPPRGKGWSEPSWEWINIKGLQKFTIQGTGTLDGQGSDWWRAFLNIQRSRSISIVRPTVLKFDSCTEVTVRDITIVNSPEFHLKFDNCRGVIVDSITISSPGDSPNTDGIHVQNTENVEIKNSRISCGDDCVSIQTGCRNVAVHHTNCGPGHGISIGSLGKHRTVACVANVHVHNIVMANTSTGARIKSWQGGSGSVRNVLFSNIKMQDVKVPIVIDQFYCDKQVCSNQTEAVVISSVKFSKISGTYTFSPFRIACSASTPCTDVDLFYIQLEPSQRAKDGFCMNSFGRIGSPNHSIEKYFCSGAAIRTRDSVAKSHEQVCWL